MSKEKHLAINGDAIHDGDTDLVYAIEKCMKLATSKKKDTQAFRHFYISIDLRNGEELNYTHSGRGEKFDEKSARENISRLVDHLLAEEEWEKFYVASCIRMHI